MNAITDTSAQDRQRAIAEACGVRLCPNCAGQRPHVVAAHGDPETCWNCGVKLPQAGHDTAYHCDECRHEWTGKNVNAATPCPACGSLYVLEQPVCAERSPFDRISNAFENWWQREGATLPGAGMTPFNKAVARIAWLQGADAAIGALRK